MTPATTISPSTRATPSPIRALLRRDPHPLRTFAAVARREWIAIVASPVAWVALAAFAIPPGVAFASATLVPGTPVSMRAPLLVAAWSLFVVAPVLAWRSVGEERRSGTWDLLLSSPAGPSSLVLGKLAALGGYLMLLSLPLLLQTLLLMTVARPDLGEILCGVAGIMTAGAVVLVSAFWISMIAPGPAAAYLLTIGLWSAWILLGRALPTVVPPQWMAAAHAIDPLRRVDSMLLGILDPADAVLLIAAGAFFVVGAIDAAAECIRPAARRGRRVARAALLAGTAISALLAVTLATQPALRRPLDLTRTRAWTLSDATRGIVASLEGLWRIEAIAGPDTVDARSLRQLDEVLARFDGLPTQGGRVSAVRLDPSDPAQAASFEEALERLERTYAAPIEAQRSAIEQGLAAFERLGAWAAAEANALTALLAALPPEAEARAGGAIAVSEADRAALEQWRAICARLATDYRAFVEERRAQARSSARAPLGDAAGAATMLDAALRAWIDHCAGAEELLRELRRRDRLPPDLRDYLREAPARVFQMAQQLTAAQDRLARLPELALSEVAAALRGGDAVIVSGPDRAAAVPGWMLLPPASTTGRTSAGFDRRFRGEEIIAAALRSLQRGVRPEVIFVHAEGRSLLRPAPDRVDLSAMADSLRSARCAVREWQPSSEPRPLGEEGRRRVWVVLPPLLRVGVEAEPRERSLLAACSKLIDAGEPVLLALAPSSLPLIGQPDPWAELARRLGVQARSGATILELVAVSEREREVRAYFELEASGGHPASRGASGMATLVTEPIPLEALPSAAMTPLLVVPPAAHRWIEDDRRTAARRTTHVPERKRFDRPISVLAAIEGPDGRRAIVSGGAAWLLSGLADMTGQLGADRLFLRYPGNRELFIGSIGWLAGLDDGFGGAAGREVERIPTLDPAIRGLLAAAGAGGASGISLAFALLLAWRRRRG